MKKLHFGTISLAFALLICLFVPTKANANGFDFVPLQREDKEYIGYVPEGVAIKNGTIPVVRAKNGGPYLVEPSELSNIAFYESSEYCMRYIGTVGDYYKVLSFDGYKVVYIAKVNAEMDKVKIQFASRSVGVYQVVAAPSVTFEEEVSEDGLTVSATPVYSTEGVSEEDFDMTTQLRPDFYYVKATKGKTATVSISTDKAGKNVVETADFTDGKIMKVEDGQYLTVKNGEIRTLYMAPKAKIEEWIADYPEAITSIEGYKLDPDAEYAWTDLLIMIAFN